MNYCLSVAPTENIFIVLIATVAGESCCCYFYLHYVAQQCLLCLLQQHTFSFKLRVDHSHYPKEHTALYVIMKAQICRWAQKVPASVGQSNGHKGYITNNYVCMCVYNYCFGGRKSEIYINYYFCLFLE